MVRDLILRAKASPVDRMFLGRWANQRHVKYQAGLVNSLYKAAFGRLAEAEGLANRIHQLQSGESLEDLAEEFVVSPEFQTRHGTSQSVDTKYLTALYRDGLGLKPDLKYLAHWLAESKKGATRARGVLHPGYCGQLVLPRTLLAVTGACVAIRRAVFFEVGGLDEINLAVVFNDVDLCLRLGDHGCRVVWTPFAELFHLESASRGLDSDDPAN